jgi:hypothetical protein
VVTIQDDLGGVRQIVEIHLLHALDKGPVLDDQVQLAVADPPRYVQVPGTHTRPASIGHGRLRVKHRAVPLEGAHAGFEKGTIARR